MYNFLTLRSLQCLLAVTYPHTNDIYASTLKFKSGTESFWPSPSPFAIFFFSLRCSFSSSHIQSGVCSRTLWRFPANFWVIILWRSPTETWLPRWVEKSSAQVADPVLNEACARRERCHRMAANSQHFEMSQVKSWPFNLEDHWCVNVCVCVCEKSKRSRVPRRRWKGNMNI